MRVSEISAHLYQMHMYTYYDFGETLPHLIYSARFHTFTLNESAALILFRASPGNLKYTSREWEIEKQAVQTKDHLT